MKITYRSSGRTSLALPLALLACVTSVVGQNQATEPSQEPASPLHRFEVRKKIPRKYDVSRIGDRGIGKGVNIYSLAREQELGKRMSGAAEATMKLLNDAVVYEYVNRIGQNVAQNSDLTVPLVLKIVYDDNVNAFSLPGGYVYVTTGLLTEADDEAQIAGVIGHEVAHIAARHATKTVSKATMWASLFRIAAVMTPGGAAAEFPKIVGADFAANVVFAKMERGAEDQADVLAVEYAYAAGYDPLEYAVLFEKLKALQKQRPSSVTKLFESHPRPETRIRNVQRAIQNYLPAREQYVVTTSSFEQVQSRLRAILDGKLAPEDQPPPQPSLKKGRSKWEPPE